MSYIIVMDYAIFIKLFYLKDAMCFIITTSYLTQGVNPFSVGTDFRRQNLTSIDDPRSEIIEKL